MNRLIKTDGSVVDLPSTPSGRDVARLIGADALDTVSRVVDGRHVMYVDDLGHQKGLPINETGTAYYHARCIPGSDPPPIRGDVVIVPMGGY